MKPLAFASLLLLTPFSVSATSNEYVRDYTYEAGDYDSKFTSRVHAIDGVKQSLIEELGTYVQSVFNVTKNSDGEVEASQDVVTLTAGVISTKILDEHWNRIDYYVKASMRADKDEVLKSLEALKNNYKLEESLRDSMQELEEARKTISNLQVMLKQQQDAASMQKLQAEYLGATRDVAVEFEYQRAVKAIIEDKLAEALERMTKLANDGYPKAQTKLGHMYERGLGADIDYQKAADWYLKAINSGDVKALSRLGFLYERGLGVRQDYGRAVELYEKAVSQGGYDGMSRLGQLYLHGNGVSKDTAKARSLFEQSINGHRHGRGYAQLGYMYEKGIDTDVDYSKAIEMYDKAIDRGNPYASARKAWLYVKGRGVDEDYEKALGLVQLAAKYNNPFGLGVLGFMYQKGLGINQDFDKAVELYKRGAEQRSAFAMFRLGKMYEKGLIHGDIEDARKWYRLAAEAGHVNAKRRLKKLSHYSKWDGF